MRLQHFLSPKDDTMLIGQGEGRKERDERERERERGGGEETRSRFLRRFRQDQNCFLSKVKEQVRCYLKFFLKTGSWGWHGCLVYTWTLDWMRLKKLQLIFVKFFVPFVNIHSLEENNNFLKICLIRHTQYAKPDLTNWCTWCLYGQ